MLATLILSIMITSCQTQTEKSLGIFDQSTNVGNPKLKGESTFNSTTKEYTLTGAGENIWFANDEFHFLSKKVEGDFILRARVKFIGAGVNAHRKFGIMVRDSLSGESAHINAVVHGDGLTSLQYRSQVRNETEESKAAIVGPNIIQLERKGDTFIFSSAIDGDTYTSVEVTDLKLEENAHVGLFICSHEIEVLETAVFDNVRLVIPAPDSLIPYRDYIGSHIEIMDIETGKRTIVHSSPLSLQAPNWTPDGSALVYNSEGKLFSFDIETSNVKEINTSFAINNNNDHVLSFDGKLQGISDHTQDENHSSLVYVLPAEGGTPELITTEAPSYLHGFSPDGEFMVYTAGRNNAEHLDIYKISRTTKEEVQLTNAPGLDDGSEYSPDGNYIYFNSTRTGTMQIWRMKPDGSEQEQLTFDEFNDWFPHISPDGKSMVFISYNADIAADDHPFYKRVYLRTMPINGGKPKVVAYLYGGQGTMNVPSWSPDSKRIAFVSNTIIE
ncbi:MAG: biopolymer transporter TolR [Prolixibacteraceae bacterium]|nr:biopolymer transporter TolR [Prolixibacteraceae bacterium]